MEILRTIYFVIRSWFDFNVMLPIWYLIIKSVEPNESNEP